MWKLEPTVEYERRLKKYVKKRPRELKAVLDNLDTFFTTLGKGVRVQQARFGFIHQEPCGVLAMDQKGGGSNLKQTRLYTYPDEDTGTLYLVTLGDKQTQREDIRFSTEFVESIKTK